LNKLDDELDNFRMAMEWVSPTSSKSGLRLIIALRFFWTERGDNREVQNWLALLLEQYKEVDSLRARALAVYSGLEARGGDLAHAQIIANQSLELSRAISDKPAEAVSLEVLGGIIARHGDLEQGIPIVEQSLALYRSLGDKLGQANATRYLSLNHTDLERSTSFLFESLKLNRELGNLSRIAFCLNELALRAIWGENFSSPGPWLEEAMAIYRQLGNQIGEAGVLAIYGLLAYWSGNYQKAVEYFEEAIALDERSSNFTMDALWSRVHMAYAILRQDNIPKAKELFELSAKEFLKASNMIGFVYAAEGLASLCVSQNQPEHAARLFAWTDVMRHKINDHRPLVEQASVERDLAVIHSQLNDAEFANLSTEGCALTLEQAIGLVTEDQSEDSQLPKA
jgi:tetratricopeptide (TPR) repeat protein